MAHRAEQVLDEILVLLAQDGDLAALERLAARWRPKHYAHARRVLGVNDGASDAVQDAWLGILKGLRGLRDPGRFPAWSYAIVTRRCQDALRSRHGPPVAGSSTDVPDPRTTDDGQSYDLRHAIAGLPEQQRAAIGLYYVEGFSVGEIAEALGIAEGTVKSRLYHARLSRRRHFSGDMT
jgi:RNA polymerase sigma-70 factor (ECF subfamily)